MTTLYDLDDISLSEIPDLDVPAWLDGNITTHQVAAILAGGCSSGAYMPAVTYYTARQTMSNHGDDVLTFIESYDELPRVPQGGSWSGIAVLFLSFAVELWCAGNEELIIELALEDEPC